MQSVSSKIWTHVAVIISYDDNHYTTIAVHAFASHVLMSFSVDEMLLPRYWNTYKTDFF